MRCLLFSRRLERNAPAHRSMAALSLVLSAVLAIGESRGQEQRDRASGRAAETPAGEPAGAEKAAEQEEGTGAEAAKVDKATSAELPLQQVVLFSSGVGYFEHRGTIRGDTDVAMQFETEAIDDLLKSMVAEDLGDGYLHSVTYSSRAPAARALQSFAVDLSENLSLADLLRQIRGQEVEVHAPAPLTGVIISTETRQRRVDDEVVEEQILNLRTAQGLKSLPLASVTSIRLLDPRIDEQFTQALEVLAGSRDGEQKSVQLHFRGGTERRVRVGYLQESPVWKLTYRLVLEDEPPHSLQGWAIVENPTRRDWQDIRLRLVSGRPISYQMPLYEPLYVDRPTVELDLYRSLRPQTYEQQLGRRMAERAEAPAPPMRGAAPESAARAGFAAGDAAGRAEGEVDPDFAAGMQTIAKTEDVGQLLQYALDEPVSVPRQQAALLPVVRLEVDGERLSIYDRSVHPKHPLRGVRLANPSDQALMEGPITVFDSGSYAGDALLENLQPGAERLISYAVDLALEVSPESRAEPQVTTQIQLVSGTLRILRQQVRETQYQVKNSGDTEAQVLVQQPRDPDWQLVLPEEPAETTRDSYRFAVDVAPGATETLVVRESRITREQITIADLSREALLHYSSNEEIRPEVREALRETARRMQEIQRVAERRNQRQQQIDEITQEQERIRKNMAELDQGTQLYSRYVERLSSQEDEIQKLREQIQQLREEENKLREELNEYLSNLHLP